MDSQKPRKILQEKDLPEGAGMYRLYFLDEKDKNRERILGIAGYGNTFTEAKTMATKEGYTSDELSYGTMPPSHLVDNPSGHLFA